MASKASAVWTGSLKEGKGTISTATGVLKDANYSFATRFEGAASGTTPEELIAAAHASCFSMALGAQLGGAGLTPTKIETNAAVTLAKVEGGFAVTKIALNTTASVPGASKKSSTKLLQMPRQAAPSRGSSPVTPRSRWTRSWCNDTACEVISRSHPVCRANATSAGWDSCLQAPHLPVSVIYAGSHPDFSLTPVSFRTRVLSAIKTQSDCAVN